MESVRNHMAQHQFKVTQVDMGLVADLNANQATAYYTAMCFQLGCAIGELIAMGIPPQALLNNTEQLVKFAVQTRTALGEQPLSDITKKG